MSTGIRLGYILSVPLIMIICGCAANKQMGGDGMPAFESKLESVLIPGGEYIMGVKNGDDDNPAHKVHIDTFYMDKYEVTNGRYFEYCRETKTKLPGLWGMKAFRCGPDFPDHPVVGVTWKEAKAFAAWCGKRLPTEAEWEYAARGGLSGKKYPGGDEIDETLANYYPSEGTEPVGSYPANGYGLHDMAGNALEWVADFYGGDYFYESPSNNPTGPEKGKFRVIRGGGWHSGPYCNMVYFRNGLSGRWVDFNTGFRCAEDAPRGN